MSNCRNPGFGGGVKLNKKEKGLIFFSLIEPLQSEIRNDISRMPFNSFLGACAQELGIIFFSRIDKYVPIVKMLRLCA